MGTIMAACMFVGLILSAPVGLIKKIPLMLRKMGASVVLAGGLWNLLWYGLQHVTEFWGLAALASGSLMIVTALYVIKPTALPKWLMLAKPVILSFLLVCAMLYAITIARL